MSLLYGAGTFLVEHETFPMTKNTRQLAAQHKILRSCIVARTQHHPSTATTTTGFTCTSHIYKEHDEQGYFVGSSGDAHDVATRSWYRGELVRREFIGAKGERLPCDISAGVSLLRMCDVGGPS